MVVYDRARSAISEMEPAAVEWPTVFSGAEWYHVTGITPALGDKGAAATAGRSRRRTQRACASASI